MYSPPQQYHFKCEIPVRIYDTNHSGSIGEAELAKIIHNSRLEFLNSFNIKATSINGLHMIVSGLNIKFKKIASYQDNLAIYILFTRIDKLSCEFNYKVYKENLELCANVSETVSFINTKTQQTEKTPKEFFDIKQKCHNCNPES